MNGLAFLAALDHLLKTLVSIDEPNYNALNDKSVTMKTKYLLQVTFGNTIEARCSH